MYKLKEREENEIKGMDENFFDLDSSEFEAINPDIPADPSPELIKKILGELPSQIEFITNKSIELQKEIKKTKNNIKTRYSLLEREKSGIRKEERDSYKKELEQYYEMMNDIFQGVINSRNKIAKGTLTDMIKTMKPKELTKSDLDDIANIKTAERQNEISQLEERLSELEITYEMMQARIRKYENKLKVAIAHKGIIVAEMQYGKYT